MSDRSEGRRERSSDEPGREGTRRWQAVGERRREIASVREEMVVERGPVGAAIDRVGRWMASPLFFTVFLASHLLWIVLNLGVVPGLEPWDPYPFVFLATLASAEAPFVALLILMRQERDRGIDELRSEVSFQVSLQVERENTQILRMLAQLGEKMDVRFEDADQIERLLEDLDPERMMSDLEERLEDVDEEPPGE